MYPYYAHRDASADLVCFAREDLCPKFDSCRFSISRDINLLITYTKWRLAAKRDISLPIYFMNEGRYNFLYRVAAKKTRLLKTAVYLHNHLEGEEARLPARRTRRCHTTHQLPPGKERYGLSGGGASLATSLSTHWLPQGHAPNRLLPQLYFLVIPTVVTLWLLQQPNIEVVAVSLNGIQFPGDIKREKDKLAKMTDEKFKQIFTLLNNLNESLDLFTKYDVDKIFDARILSVDSGYRGKGLGKEIIRRAEEVASENNFQIMKGDATGAFSQKILLSLGWKLIHELKYVDHLDENGEQIFKPPPPHQSLKIMIKKLN
ncbi:hypothetical protein J6590_040293 [Homalodisca vitripennis]|nr:hypothetical protein J6590_040293 [Homalodisca vitripennis]